MSSTMIAFLLLAATTIGAAPARAIDVKRVVIAGFDVRGADASVGARAAAAVANGLVDFDVVDKRCTPRPECVKDLARAHGADFAVHGSLDVDASGIRVTVDVVELVANRRFARRVAVADNVDDAPLVARDVALALLSDPASGFTPHVVAGVLTIVAGGVAFGAGAAGLLWIDSVRDDPNATARERADAEGLDMPISIIGAAGMFTVIIGAGIIIGADWLAE